MPAARRLRALLSQEPGNASRKKDFRFPTKEQTGFQIEAAEQCCAPETEAAAPGDTHREHPLRPCVKTPLTSYFYKSFYAPNDEPERYMLNMRFPLQSCLIVFGGSDWVGFHFVAWRWRKKIFIKLYLITVIWNKRGWTD